MASGLWCRALAATFAATLASSAHAVTFWEFNRSIDGVFPDPNGWEVYRDPAGGTFNAVWDGVSAARLTGTLGDFRSKQFGHFGREYGLTEGSQYALDLVINPGNQATGLSVGLVEYGGVGTVVDEWGQIEFDLTGLAPGPHTVIGTFTPVAGATLSNLRSIEVVKPRYYSTDPIDVTLDRIKTVGHGVTFLSENFNSVFGTPSLAEPGRVQFVLRSATNSETPFNPLANISTQGVGGTKGATMTVDASTLSPPFFEGPVWSSSLVAQLDFREGYIPWGAENVQFNFDAKGAGFLAGPDAGRVTLQIVTFNDAFNAITGVLEGSVQLAAENTFQSFSVSAADFVVPEGASAPDFASTRNVQFIWQINGQNWGFDAGNTLTIDNVVLKAVDLAAPTLSGDYNADGQVNAADYTVWRDNLGAPTEAPINNAGDGLFGVDAGDYSLWVSQYGTTASSATAVPEPTTLFVLASGAAFAAARKRV